MARFDESIDVNASVSEAYNLFSQFERFPGFMEGVEEVRRTGPDRLHWKAEIGGREEEWEAEITKQEPDTAIAWQSVSGARNAGEVTFEKLDQDTTQINLHIEYEPEGFIENVGALLGVVNGRMRGDLQRFKDLVESGGHDTGWHDPAERSSAAADRDRQVGEAQRSVHRDDVGYENRDRGGIAREHDMNRDMNRDMDLDRDPSRDANRGLAGGRDRADAVAGGAIGAAGSAVERNVDRAGTTVGAAGSAVERNVDRAGRAVDANLERAGSAVDSGADDVRGSVHDGIGRADEAANRTADRVSDMANRGAERAAGWSDRAADGARDLGDRGADAARDFADRGADSASDLADRVDDRLDRGRHEVSGSTDDLDRADDADPLTRRNRRDS